MDRAARLAQLLEQWEERFEKGTALSSDELCRECPELAEELQQKIDALQSMKLWLNTNSSAGDIVEPASFRQSSAEAGEAIIDSDARQAVAAGKAPRELGNYILEQKIGAGGMGQVFLARHRRMKRQVALKILHASTTAGEKTVMRFEREVELVAQLSHPNIVTAYDADEVDGVYFFVMEYVDGTNLSSLVKESGPLPPQVAADYICQAARGLEYAHGKGIIHRDIKPANLLLDASGTVKVLDMGLARLEAAPDVATQPELTGTNTVMGTADYMSPEQALDTKRADARSDIYSLGCTLFTLVTGRTMYGGDTLMKKLLAHREADIPPMTSAGSSTSEPALAELETIYRKMAAKDPAERHQSMSEVVAALRAIAGRAAAASDSVGHPRPTRTAPSTIAHLPSAGGDKSVSDTVSSRTGEKTVPMVVEQTGNRRQTPIRRRVLIVASSLVAGLLLLAVVWASGVFTEKNSPEINSRQKKSSPADGNAVVKAVGKKTKKKPPDVKKAFAPRGIPTLQFDGKGYVDLPTLQVDLTKPFTFECYAHCEPRPGKRSGLISNSGQEGFCLFLDDKANMVLEVNGPRTGHLRKIEKWVYKPRTMHIAVTSDTRYVNVFLDGVLSDHREIHPQVRWTGKTRFVLGKLCDRDAAFGALQGTIGEIRFSNTIRYTQNFTPPIRFTPDEQTLALYHCDSGKGKTLVDSSGNNHHGVIH